MSLTITGIGISPSISPIMGAGLATPPEGSAWETPDLCDGNCEVMFHDAITGWWFIPNDLENCVASPCALFGEPGVDCSTSSNNPCIDPNLCVAATLAAFQGEPVSAAFPVWALNDALIPLTTPLQIDDVQLGCQDGWIQDPLPRPHHEATAAASVL